MGSNNEDATGKARCLPRHVPALNTWRLLAALHVVVYHRYCLEGQSVIFAEWGGTWVSFFFTLSGFGATYSRLATKPAGSLFDDPVDHLLPSCSTLSRRMLAVYPIYLVAFIFCLILEATEGHTRFNVVLVTLESLLLHDWIPNNARCQMDEAMRDGAITLNGYITSLNDLDEFNRICNGENRYDGLINQPDWYVSCLAAFWLFENALYELAACAARAGRLGFRVAFAGLLIWMVVWPYAGFPPLWGDVSGVSRGWIIDPLSYVHQYFAGVLLAFYLHYRTASGRPPILGGWAASGAATVLLGVFLIPAQFNINGWFKHFGGLLPLHTLIIVGMVEGDVLCKVLGVGPLPMISTELAYPIYMLQAPFILGFPNFLIAPTLPDAPQFVIRLLLLGVAAAFVAICVQKPAAKAASYLLPGLLAGKGPGVAANERTPLKPEGTDVERPRAHKGP